jgi:uncharacterized delta-60 repeat protein
LTADGSIDIGFGDNGLVHLSFGAGNNILNALQVDRENRTWLLVGTIPSNTLLRLNADGQLDPAFGTNGALALGTPCCHGFHSLAIDQQGRIPLGGTVDTNTGQFAVQRRLSNGQIDTTFAQQGTFTTTINAASNVQGLLVTAEGMIVAVGNSGSLAGGSTARRRMTALRLSANGQLDTTFGNNGISIIDFGGEENGYSFPDVRADLGKDGKILITRATSEAGAVRVARLLPNGALDSTFYQTGKTTMLHDIRAISFARGLIGENRFRLTGAYSNGGVLTIYAGSWQDGDGIFRDAINS